MTYFARKLEYAAHDGEAGASFLALIELGKRKGRPTKYFLYRCVMFYKTRVQEPRVEYKLVELQVKNAEEARSGFWPFVPGNQFPPHGSSKWKKTTKWLSRVAVGGAYEWYPQGVWARVPTPALWEKRRKKRPLQVFNIGCILHAKRGILKALQNDKEDLVEDLSDLHAYDDVADESYIPEENEREAERIKLLISSIEEEIRLAGLEIERVKGEMRFKRSRMLLRAAA